MPIPDPNRTNPATLPDGTEHAGTVMLSQVTDHPRFQVGEYTYASDFEPPENWATHLAPYLFENSAERLIIGKFCQIAHGVRFITASANHAQTGITCYPFPIFDPTQMADYQPDTRDTVIGHDVWIGYGALILPGARIGSGAIIGAGTVVRGEIPPYAVVTGNPGTVLKHRFPEKDIAALLSLEWWHWPHDLLQHAEQALLAGDIAALQQVSPH
ncbi:MAG: antibiotic acetyltransferase [Rhodobacteraceae bacterium]|nr:antibiotic acetyltransferase [Paracoccaceae bacterium]